VIHFEKELKGLKSKSACQEYEQKQSRQITCKSEKQSECDMKERLKQITIRKLQLKIITSSESRVCERTGTVAMGQRKH
jgi:hypothetical protein